MMSNKPYKRPVFLNLSIRVIGRKTACCRLCQRATACLSVETKWTDLDQDYFSVCEGCFGKVTKSLYASEVVGKFFRITVENLLDIELYCLAYEVEETFDAKVEEKVEEKVAITLDGLSRAFVSMAKKELGGSFSKIEAIKLLREITGPGLATPFLLSEAKRLVERGMEQLAFNGNGQASAVRRQSPTTIGHSTAIGHS